MPIRKIIFIALLIILALYTGWVLIFGRNGLRTLKVFSVRKQELAQQQRALQESKIALEKKVNRMRANSLDLDSIDEAARKNLGYAQDGEKIYLE